MAVSKEERALLNQRIRSRVKAVLAWKKLDVEEVNTEYGWNPKRMKRLLKGEIQYKLDDAVILANTFGLPLDFFSRDFGENELQKVSMMIMFSELSEEHQKDIIEMMQADDIEKASKDLIEKLQAEKKEN